jgi:hypothetical protein
MTERDVVSVSYVTPEGIAREVVLDHEGFLRLIHSLSPEPVEVVIEAENGEIRRRTPPLHPFEWRVLVGLGKIRNITYRNRLKAMMGHGRVPTAHL